MRRTLCMLLALGAAAAQAADFKADARVWGGAGIDTNPSRDFTSPGTTTSYDVFGALLASASGIVNGEWGRIFGSYEFGGRKFFLSPTQDTEVQSASLDGSIPIGKYLGVGADVRARDRRGAERDYSDLLGEAYLDFVPDNAVSVRAHAGAHRFLYWNLFSASYGGPTFGAFAQYRFNRRHQVFVSLDFEPRTYNAYACISDTGNSCDTSTPPPIRDDTSISVSVGYTYRGPLLLTFGYSYLDLTSNSFGETYRRHRFSGTAGLRLPLDFTLLASAAYQLAQYPEGVCLSGCMIRLEDDAENASNASVKLVHPLGTHFDFDVRYAVYFDRLARKDLTYLRMVGSLGIGWRW